MTDVPPSMPGPSTFPFLTQVRDTIRVRHLSIRTEQAYLHWIKRFILFHRKRHPSEMAEPDVSSFLTHLAVAGTSRPQRRTGR